MVGWHSDTPLTLQRPCRRRSPASIIGPHPRRRDISIHSSELGFDAVAGIARLADREVPVLGSVLPAGANLPEAHGPRLKPEQVAGVHSSQTRRRPAIVDPLASILGLGDVVL